MTTTKPDLTNFKLTPAEEKLAALFMYDHPWQLGYNYRKKASTWPADKSTLESLMRKGLIHMIDKSNKIILYRLTLPVSIPTREALT